MRRRRSTRSVIKLLAAAVATASIVGLVRPSTPRRLPTLADRLKVRFARFAPMADAGADQPTLPKGLGTVEMRLDPDQGEGREVPKQPVRPDHDQARRPDRPAEDRRRALFAPDAPMAQEP